MKQRIQGFLVGVLVSFAALAIAAPSTRITYNASAPGGAHLALAIKYSRQALQEINLAQSIASSVTAGGATQANLEGSAEFNAAVGLGPTLYSAITALQTDLQAIQNGALIGNLDQGN